MTAKSVTHYEVPAAGASRIARIPCIVNVTAGNGKAVLEAVERDARFTVRTCEPDNVRRVVRDAMESGAARIAVAGGDGTVATAAGVLIRSGIELAVLPAGTRDHFARLIYRVERRALQVIAA